MVSHRVASHLGWAIAICIVAAAIVQGQKPAKCADFNEYCQNHWDCCSNSCMSFLYRCTRNYQFYPYPFLGESYPSESTQEDILAAVFGNQNRLQGESNHPNGAAAHTPHSFKTPQTPQIYETPQVVHTSNPNAIGVNNRFGSDEVSTTEATTETTTFDAVDEQTTTAEAATTWTVCKQISARCFGNDECCSKRCDNYFRECVATPTLRA